MFKVISQREDDTTDGTNAIALSYILIKHQKTHILVIWQSHLFLL